MGSLTWTQFLLYCSVHFLRKALVDFLKAPPNLFWIAWSLSHTQFYTFVSLFPSPLISLSLFLPSLLLISQSYILFHHKGTRHIPPPSPEPFFLSVLINLGRLPFHLLSRGPNPSVPGISLTQWFTWSFPLQVSADHALCQVPGYGDMETI